MKTYILSVFLLSMIATLPVCAQRELQNPLVDSKKIIEEGVKLAEAGKYKEAVAEYLKVPASDTAYPTVLHEIILNHYNDSNYVAAEKFAMTALDLYPSRHSEWYDLLSNIYDDTKRTELASRAFDSVLAQDQYNYRTFFNKGISLFRQLKYEEATACFQRSVMLNPFFSSAHYQLANIQLLKGNMVQAMMSFTTSLLVVPGNKYRRNAVGHMVTISEVNTTATEYLAAYKPQKEDNFDELQDILLSKVALDKKYKLKASLEDPIVRQLQVFMEKLEYNPNDKGFWMQYYVPFLKSVWDKGQFEPFVFYIFSELDLKQVNEYGKKQKRKTEEFTDLASKYFLEIRETQELIESKRKLAKTRYSVNNFKVTGKGGFGKNLKNEDILTGPWEFYYTDGRLRSKGNFDAAEMREGEWRFYHDNGQLKEISFYTKGLANGVSKSWFDNGFPSSVSTYKDDKLENEETSYFYNGRLRSVINYKAGKKDGKARYYNVDGYLRTIAHYKDDKQEGEEIVYHPNGKVFYTLKYVNDEGTGEYKEYFDNGNLQMVGTFAAGTKTGAWTTFYSDGKPKQQETYVAGELEGPVVTYYANGKIESRRFYKKGEIDSKKEDFDDDGVVFSEGIFENGRLRDIKFFDKKGNVISNTTSRKGNANITFYNADGIKSSQGYYSKDGMAEGKFLYFFLNGTVSAESFYKNGMQHGKRIDYYSNGKVSQEGSYKEDKADGYFINYFTNGQVSWEGWYTGGERQGTFINYNLLGKVTSKIYYLDGQTHGISEHYTPTGKLDYKEFYDHDWLNKIEQYDSTGKVLVSSVLNKGEGKILFTLSNGKPYIQSYYQHYQLQGTHTTSNGDGSKRSMSYYNRGLRDSNYVAWYPNGKISTQGKYSRGLKTGEWKYYFDNGQLSETETYVEGLLEGADIQYNQDGSIDKKISFKNGESDGETRIYGENGKLALVLYNKENEIKGYSYEDKTGKLIPMIPILNGSGTVESYYSNGVKSALMTFREGVIEGQRIIYFSNGKEYISGTRIMGMESGPKKIFYPSGKIMQEENYYHGQRHGSFKHYNENGTLVSDLNYYLDAFHGECKYFTAGKLAATYVYYFGEMESKK